MSKPSTRYPASDRLLGSDALDHWREPYRIDAKRIRHKTDTSWAIQRPCDPNVNPVPNCEGIAPSAFQ